MLSDVQHALKALPLDQPLIVLADFDGTLAEFHPNCAAGSEYLASEYLAFSRAKV